MARDVRETYEPMPGTDKALLPGAIEIERTEQHRRESEVSVRVFSFLNDKKISRL